jgi:mitogen-activated protein kinase organizer 1
MKFLLLTLINAFLSVLFVMSSSKAPLPNQKLHTLQGHRGAVNVARYTVDGSYCLTGGQDRDVRLWNPTNGKFIQKYSAHGWEVYDICR